MSDLPHWRDIAACSGIDPRLFYRSNPQRAKEICGPCPVRAECLYDALDHTAPQGVWGGLTASQRRELPPLEGPRPVTIDALRALLDEIDDQGGPEAARNNRLHLANDPDERPTSMNTSQPMRPQTDGPVLRPVGGPGEPEQLPVGKLLAWGDGHTDGDVRDQAARARLALAGLRKRHAADQELTAVTTEAEQLEKRLAELRAREAELAPQTVKARRKPVGYPAAEVRAWAKKAGMPCSPVGRVPKQIVDAWRQATTAAAEADA